MSARRPATLRLLALFALVLVLQPFGGTSAAPTAAPAARAAAATKEALSFDPNDPTLATYIVRLRGEPVALAPNLPRRSDDSQRADARPDLESPAADARRAAIATERSDAITAMQRATGLSLQPTYIYDTAFNGMALELTGPQAAQIARLPEVAAVEREQIYELDSDAGPAWIGADTIWDGSVTGVFAATILGANEVPPVNSPAQGGGRFVFNPATSTLSYQIAITGLTEEIIGAHIHRGAPGANGGVLASLTAGPLAGSYVGSAVLAPADVALLQSDGLYVNFHTNSNPGGEVRGNISGYKGEGIVVGIIDSGINTTHPSFAELGGDGYRHLNPRGDGNFKGACDPNNLPSVANGNPSGYNPAIQCNDKLIGAWTFAQTAVVPSPANEPSPNDDDGHGSHTASTAAGNVLLNVTSDSATYPRISGVAPHANIIAYDVCGFLSNGSYSGSCPGAALLAAANQAVADGVDVINYSISGGNSPWTESVEIAFRNARAAGVVVATSAGNRGPATDTVGHVSPWLLATAATTHNRTLVNSLTNLTTAGGITLPNINGAGSTAGLATDTAIVYAGAPSIDNPLCDVFTPAQAAAVAGKIVVCDRGTFGRVEKSQNVAAAGGVGYVLANDMANGSSLVADAFAIPGVHITYNDGVTLKNWLAAHPFPTGRISGVTRDISDAYADRMAAFSSRGPRTGDIASILKPDLAAPGVDVIAAIANDGAGGNDFGLLSGTSMASPHAAGSAALLAGLYPTWTPGQIQSALTTTSFEGVLKEDGVSATTPFDRGAGRIQLERAALAGLVLDETDANFIAANPATGGDPRTLNVPSMIDPACIGSCSWTRAVRSTLPFPVTWTASTGDPRVTVSPASFTLQPGANQTFTVTYDVNGLPEGTYVFGRVTLSATGDLAPDAAFPVAALPVNSDLPADLLHTASSGVDSISRNVRTIAYSALQVNAYGLVEGTPKALSLAESAQDVTTLSVPGGAKRLVAEIRSSTSLDVDIYIYRDDGDGVLDGGDTEVCASASGAVLEYCNLNNPSAGTYHVQVVNYAASGAGPDPIQLMTAVVPNTDAANLTVTAPGESDGGEITLGTSVNLPTSEVGDVWYGGFSLVDSSNSTVVASATYDFEHVLGLPSNLAPSGTPQSAPVGAAFATPLQVTVTDNGGNPLPDVQVSFGAPATGASAALSAATATTDANGQASVTATANQTAGSYSVTASVTVNSSSLSTSFNLTNTAGPLASLSASGGTPQSTAAGTAFAAPLQALASDQFGNPVAGAQVSFSAPATGASADLSGAAATTDASGLASVTATAGSTLGSYSVTATANTAGGTVSATFSLTNLLGPATNLSVSAGANQQAQVGVAFATPLRVTVTDSGGNPVAGVQVSFSAPATGASAALSATTATTNASGQASVTATANTTAGSYSVTARITGPNGLVTTTFNLTNTAAPVTTYWLYLPLSVK